MDDRVGPEDGDGPLRLNTPATPALKKRGGVGRGMAQDDAALDLILFAREKKWSLTIPTTAGTTTCAAGSAVNAANRLRVVHIKGVTTLKGGVEENNWEHLVGEVKGTRYRVGLAARPELEYHLVGFGAKSLVKSENEENNDDDEDGEKGKKGKKGKKSAKGAAKARKGSLLSNKKGAPQLKGKKAAAAAAAAAASAKPEVEIPTDQSDGRGIEVLYDAVKNTYIISDSIEDQLILLFRNDPVAALRVHASYLKYFDMQVNTMDNMRNRMWRRYVRFHLQHKIWDDTRFLELCNRFEDIKRKNALAAQVLDASQLDSATDSDEEKNDSEAASVVSSVKSEKIKKLKGKGKNKGESSASEDEKPRPSSRK